MNEKYVINIGRQYGAGGLLIAQKLAEILGINYYDKNLIDIAAKKSGLAKEFFEKAEEKSTFGIFGDLSGWFSSVFSMFYGGGDNVLLDDLLFKVQSDIIKQLARKESCIFVGRSADYVLRENARCVNIFVSGNMEDRIERVSGSVKPDCAGIRKKIEQTDRQRAKYYGFYTGRQWGAAASYHLCVNSSVLGIDETVGLIRSFAVKKLNLK